MIMKNLRRMACIFIVLACVTGCKDDKYIPNVVKQTFNTMYPKTSFVDWEEGTKHGYYVVEFRHDGKEKIAWFDAEGLWWLTETDIRDAKSKLPKAIQNHLNQSQYASWQIDDIDYIEKRHEIPFFVVEVERRDVNINLFYLEDGTFIKETDGDDDEHNRPTPATMKNE